jgi:hypothetical protein
MTSNAGAEIPGVSRNVRATRKDRFEAFDKLPKKVRQALAAGEADWCPISVRKGARKRKMRVNDLVQRIRERNYQIWCHSYPGIEEVVMGTASESVGL